MCEAIRLDEPLGDDGCPEGQDRGAVDADRELTVGHSQSLATTPYLDQAGARNVGEGGRREAGEGATCGTYSRSYRTGAWRRW
jgi:hypothetical protein